MIVQHPESFYIDRKWVVPSGSKRLAVENPATEEMLGSIALGGAEDVERAVKAARAAFPTWSSSDISERKRLLENVRDVYIRRRRDLADAVTLELGCPTDLSYGVQAGSGAAQIDAFLKAMDDIQWIERLANGDELHRESKGVAGLITPWNWPLNQIGLKVFAALAAGSTMVLKPSEITPFNAMLFAEILDEAGCPKGVFNLVNGLGNDVGAALVSHPDVDCVSFTGSTKAGRLIYAASAERIKPISLELGGKSPCILFADCDVATRIKQTLKGLFSNSGQNCNGPTRLLVERSAYETAKLAATEVTARTAVGDPRAAGDHIGPVANRRQFDHIQRLLQSALDDGAELLTGGLGKPDGIERGHYVRPTVFAGVDNSMAIAREEVFGPVAVLIPFDTEEDAIAIANDSDFGLAAYVHTDDAEKLARVVRRMQAGMVFKNGNYLSAGSPFGGVKMSGIGKEGGVMGIEEFLDAKLVA
ncbi:aldehyde dehydrogenase family protein [Roseibium sp. SCPC15]|uniref:aldehyde dehydrogenase family protein n=1 Tax=Roseibium sp. SCP15 TaxID=3141376 RepID=UPI003338D11A